MSEQTGPADARSTADEPPLGGRILAALGPTPIDLDGLLRDLGVAPAEAATALSEIERIGPIERRAGH